MKNDFWEGAVSTNKENKNLILDDITNEFIGKYISEEFQVTANIPYFISPYLALPANSSNQATSSFSPVGSAAPVKCHPLSHISTQE